jgi:apolipoprotein N-acyltransferase
MRRVPMWLWILSAVSALLQILPFPIAGPVPPLRRLFCWVCLVPLLLALTTDGRKAPSTKQCAWIGYLCGVLWYLGNCYWIYQTMYLYGGIAKPISLLILLLFSLYVGLYHALFGACIGWLRTRWGRTAALAISPLCWVAVELARARITGFPWDLLGNTLVEGSAARILAPVAGVMGLSLLVAAVNAGIAALLWAGVQRRSSRSFRSLLLWAAAVVLFSTAAFVTSTQRLTVNRQVGASAVLMQENLDVGAEATGPKESKQQMFVDFSARSLAAERPGTDVMLWPESPAPFEDADPAFRAAMASLAQNARAPVIVDNLGVDLDHTDSRGYKLYNSADVFNAAGEFVGRYDKMHLVPFGEYTPYKQIFFFAGSLLDDVGKFSPGKSRQTFLLGGRRYGVFICYESIFGDEIRQFVLQGANVLVNLSNDGWYGDTSAPWEHLDMVRMRAIENHRWVLRATNTGISGAISPDGVLTTDIPRHQRLAALVGFNFEDGTTFYTRHGDWIAWICAAITAFMMVAGYWRRPRAEVAGFNPAAR